MLPSGRGDEQRLVLVGGAAPRNRGENEGQSGDGLIADANAQRDREVIDRRRQLVEIEQHVVGEHGVERVVRALARHALPADDNLRGS